MAFFIICAWGHEKPIGVPLNIQETNTIVSAPLFTISDALVTAFFPGQSPQVLTPIISISSGYPVKSQFFVFHHLEASRSRTHIFCLHTSD
jgi:hypothetical protein